jgi:copper(I)-binding protein
MTMNTLLLRAAFVAASLALSAPAGLVLSPPALAHSVTAGDLAITGLWTQAVPPGAPTALGYLTIENKGSAPDRLVSISSPIADHGELHTMTMDGGVMRMRAIALPATIAPGQKLVLSPTGNHIMLIGLKQRPVAGGTVPLTLTFEKAGTVTTYLHVVPIGGSAPTPHDDNASSGAKP